ncbi:MAG: site-specific integrase [Desulfuromonadaceae bacterium]|nr:site-specific integrase [Desulfuromonadaceae bacterium]
MKAKFDDPTIRNLQTAAKTFDCMAEKEPGFGIRVHPSGTMTFFYLYKIDGQRRFMALGTYPTTTLKKARELYQAEAIKVKALRRGSADGSDPVLEKKRKQERRIAEAAEQSQALTVAGLVKEYVERHAMKFKRSWQEDERLLNKEIVSVWGKRKASDITKRDMTLLLESIVDRGTPAMSNQVLKVVRKMFNFAVERDILQHTPCTGVKALSPNIRRERTLNETEMKTLWGSMNNAAISDEIKRALKLVLLTAQRPGEVSGMHVKEIDGHWWTIPAERSKNGKEHRVYLTDTAIEIINAAIEDNKKGLINHNLRMKKEKKPEVPITDPYSGFIFPCPHKDKVQAIDSHALPVSVRRNLAWPLTDTKGKPLYKKDGKPATENRLLIDQFTPHDLRRTAATFMASMGYMDEIIDAVLNHVKQGIIRTYNRHDYAKEKQQALESWERKLLSIVTEKTKKDNVTSINEGKRKAA